MNEIFISYRRRSRAEELALMLYQKLTNEGYSVSHDHSTFHESKLPFDVTIEKRLDDCTDFICIISQDTFDRCEEPNYNIDEDWIVHEIISAIKKNKNIIPVRLDIDNFPKNIPNQIEKLGFTRYNGPKYSAEYFDAFYHKLKDFFKTKSLQNERADALYEKSIYFLKVGNYTEAIKLLFESASSGSPGACCKLGELYLRTNNGEEWNLEYDPQKGIAWLNKAYNKGYPHAFHELGLLYLWGLNAPKDPNKAIELFKEGAELGDSDCMNQLGLCFLNGVVVLQDDKLAVNLFKKSADCGNANGMLNFAMCCREGRGILKDDEMFFKYVKSAAMLDLPKAHHFLACAYFTGEGTIQNLKKAFEEFGKAYQMGEIDDIFNLAYCYENGYGTEKDLNKAVGLLQECIELATEKKRFDLIADAYETYNKLKSIISK